MAERNLRARLEAAQDHALRALYHCISDHMVGVYEYAQHAQRMRDAEVSRLYAWPAVHPSTVVRDIVHNSHLSDDFRQQRDDSTDWNTVTPGSKLRRVDLELYAGKMLQCLRCQQRISYWRCLARPDCPAARNGASRRDHIHLWKESAEPPFHVPPRLLEKVPHHHDLDMFLRFFRVVPEALVAHVQPPGHLGPSLEKALRTPIRAYTSFTDLFEMPFCIIPRGVPLLGGIAPFKDFESDLFIDMVYVYMHYILPSVDVSDVSVTNDVSVLQARLSRELQDSDDNDNADPITLASGYTGRLDEAASRDFGPQARFVPFVIYARTTDIIENQSSITWGKTKYTARQRERRRRSRKERTDMARLYSILVPDM